MTTKAAWSLTAGIAVLTVAMVLLTGYWAVAMDGGTVGLVASVVWAVGGVCIIGALWRGVLRHGR